MINQEVIKFNLSFTPTYALLAPYIKIFIDNEVQYTGVVKQSTTISFSKKLEFGKHKLCIHKEYSQPNQLLNIDQIKIDGVDIRDIIWHYSYSVPVPNPSNEKNIGETCLGRNCIWTLEFSSPCYMFIINWMKFGNELNP